MELETLSFDEFPRVSAVVVCSYQVPIIDDELFPGWLMRAHMIPLSLSCFRNPKFFLFG